MSDMTEKRIALAIHRQRVIFRIISRNLLAFSEQIEQHLINTALDLDDPHSPLLGTGRLRLEPEELRHALGYFFPQTLRASLFVTTFADVEHYFCNLARNIQQVNPSRLNVSDLQGKGIEQAHTYLTKVTALVVSNDIWDKICFLKELRNVIIHAGRRIEPGSRIHKTLTTAIKKWRVESIELTDDSFLFLREGFNHMAIEASSALFEDIVSQNCPQLETLN